MKKINVALPYAGWMARPHQLKLWEYLVTGGKRAIAVWHRRAGKDEVALHHTAVQAAKRSAITGTACRNTPRREKPSGQRSILTPANGVLMKRSRSSGVPPPTMGRCC